MKDNNASGSGKKYASSRMRQTITHAIKFDVGKFNSSSNFGIYKTCQKLFFTEFSFTRFNNKLSHTFHINPIME